MIRNVALLSLLFFLGFQSLSWSSQLSPQVSIQQKVNPEFQWRIVELFSATKCGEIREMVRPEYLGYLRPNILAIVAFCKPSFADPEELFQKAENADPSGDLIMLLHAKYIWKIDPEKAKPYWEKVLKYARNDYLRKMAHEYIEGNVTTDEIIHLGKITYQGGVHLGALYENNPNIPYDSDAASKSAQTAEHMNLNLGIQHWFPFGSISGSYSGKYNHYVRDTRFSLLENKFDFPISLRMGTYEDLVFRSFGKLISVGGHRFQNTFGIGVLGIAYRPEYKQSVEGSIFYDSIFLPQLSVHEGAHQRFDYNWEFFPRSWLFHFLAFMEHVNATHDHSNGTEINYAHTDIGTSYKARYTTKGISLALTLKGVYRIDSELSAFTAKNNGALKKDRRSDFLFSAQPEISFPLLSYVQGNIWYEYSRNFSNLGTNDYANYNMTNHIVGLFLSTEFSNY